jgi:hypothetical protein
VTAEEGAPKLLWDAGSREGSNTWLLFDLKGPQSYIGALATTRPCTLRYHTFVA